MSRLALAAAVLATVTLAGCGDEDEPSAESAAANLLPTPLPSGTTTPRSEASPSPGATTDDTLASVTADVRRAAPRLEGYFRGMEYPRALADVEKALPKAGVTLAKGNRLGAYTYDADAVEFVLCVENSSGAWATYDTAPMATGEKGTTGGCP